MEEHLADHRSHGLGTLPRPAFSSYHGLAGKKSTVIAQVASERPWPCRRVPRTAAVPISEDFRCSKARSKGSKHFHWGIIIFLKCLS